MKSKKGVTLVELICGIAIIGIALIFGVQLWVVAANGTARGAELDRETQQIVTVFEGGTDTDVQETRQSNTMSFTLGGKTFTLTEDMITATAQRVDGTASQMKIREASKEN